jgi:hypothetical protein
MRRLAWCGRRGRWPGAAAPPPAHAYVYLPVVPADGSVLTLVGDLLGNEAQGSIAVTVV